MTSCEDSGSLMLPVRNVEATLLSTSASTSMGLPDCSTPMNGHTAATGAEGSHLHGHTLRTSAHDAFRRAPVGGASPRSWPHGLPNRTEPLP